MELDGPPRMVGWITWSGRERSSQTQFLSVPGVWLIHPSFQDLMADGLAASLSVLNQFLSAILHQWL